MASGGSTNGLGGGVTGRNEEEEEEDEELAIAGSRNCGNSARMKRWIIFEKGFAESPRMIRLNRERTEKASGFYVVFGTRNCFSFVTGLTLFLDTFWNVFFFQQHAAKISSIHRFVKLASYTTLTVKYAIRRINDLWLSAVSPVQLCVAKMINYKVHTCVYDEGSA